MKFHTVFSFVILAVAFSLFNTCARVRGGPIPALSPTKADVDDGCNDATQSYRLDDCSDVEWSKLFDEQMREPNHVPSQQQPSHPGVSSPQGHPSTHSIDDYFNADCSDFSIMMDDSSPSSPQAHRSDSSEGTSDVEWGSTAIPNPQSPSETPKSSKPPQVPRNRKKYLATWGLRRKLHWQDQELQDPKKREEVQKNFDIWKGKNHERFNAFQTKLREKETAARELDLQESEIKILLMRYQWDFMKKIWEEPQIRIAREQEQALKILRNNKDIEDGDARAKVEKEVMEWKKSLKEKNPREFDRVGWRVKERHRVWLDLRLSAGERSLLELVYMRDIMRHKQNEGDIRDWGQRATLKTLRENEDLKDKNVQAAVEAKFTQWRETLKTKDYKRFRQVDRNRCGMKKRMASLKVQPDEDKKRILEIAYMRKMMLKRGPSGKTYFAK
ncbi:hypothetical protein H0H93_009757 [Arthromyces matolae]|nr:hypothetical protein H0H93_009757 [Arthromyces matolae]